MKKTLGIVGCGVIGSALAEFAAEKLKEKVAGIVLWDMDEGKTKRLAERLPSSGICTSMEETAEKADIVIEAASPAAVNGVLRAALAGNKDVMIMSVGGILGNEGLLDDARRKNIKILVPSGAISGIDAVKAAKNAGLESVAVTTRKAPRSIKGAPYLAEKGIDVDTINEETVVFEGSAKEAIKGFPKNVNVSALLSLAGIGPEKTRVRIIVSPEYTKNTHEIEVRGTAGVIRTRTENVPSPKNPKTSYLAALAAITSLQGYFDSVRFGT